MKDDKLSAKERADLYRKGDKASDGEERQEKAVRTEEQWADIVDRQIAEAIRRGAFENLPGQGKPLDLSRDSMVPDDQQMAFKLLRNNDLAPTWISDRKDIQARVERFHKSLRSSHQWHRNHLMETSDDAERLRIRNSWRRQIERWETEVQDLNRRILSYNLQRPVAHLEIVQLRLDEALRKAGAGRDLSS